MLRLKQLVYAALLALLGITPMSALAIGQVTDPIVINDALRGEEFQEEMIIINTESRDITISLSADGDIANWASFYKTDDLTTPVESVDLTAEERLNLIVVFTIPEDVENGEYTGIIGVSEKVEADDSQETVSTLTQRIDREATINVSDNENVELILSVIPESYDLKAGDPLIMRVIYDNQGNISVKPQIDFKIKNIETEEVVYNVIFPYPEEADRVKPATQHEIPQFEVATDDLAAGKYFVQMDALHNGENIATTDFNITIESGMGLQALGIMVVIVVAIILVVVVSKRNHRRGGVSQPSDD